MKYSSLSNIESEQLEQVCTALRSLSSALICTHVFPDADAIGSSCAMQLGLSQIGKKAQLHLPQQAPEVLLPLLKSADISYDLPTEVLEAVIVVDTANQERIGFAGSRDYFSGKKVICIDHHFSNSQWAEFNFVLPQAPASSFLVAQILQRLGVNITPEIADLLYAGLLDDTGCFRYSNTTAESLEYAAWLINAGARPQEVANALYFSLPQRILRLRAEALNSLRLALGGKIAVISLSRKLLEQCQAQPADTEGLVDLARSVSGTVGAVFMRELEDGVWKLSLRSKSAALDVNQVAGTFSGGGHIAAAGCKIKGAEKEVEKLIIERLAQEF